MESTVIEGATDLAERYQTVLTLIVGAVVITATLWRVVLRPILMAVRELGDQMRAVRELAEAQLTTNGGGTLVDKVNHLHEWRPSVDARLEEVKETAERTEARVETNTHKFDKLGDDLSKGLGDVHDEFERRAALMRTVMKQMPEPQRSVFEGLAAELGERSK